MVFFQAKRTFTIFSVEWGWGDKEKGNGKFAAISHFAQILWEQNRRKYWQDLPFLELIPVRQIYSFLTHPLNSSLIYLSLHPTKTKYV